MITLTFDWPKDTSLNARLHWAKRASITRDNRLLGMQAVRDVTLEQLPPGLYRATYSIHPPRRGRFDDDNLMTRLKGHRDGFCQALGIDDSCLRSVIVWRAVVKGGKIVVDIEPIAA